jgi:carboxypeptidase C (cathepsin A)
MGLDPAVRGNLTMSYYEAGHMMYIHLDSLQKFKADFTAYMDATLKSAGVK